MILSLQDTCLKLRFAHCPKLCESHEKDREGVKQTQKIQSYQVSTQCWFKVIKQLVLLARNEAKQQQKMNIDHTFRRLLSVVGQLQSPGLTTRRTARNLAAWRLECVERLQWIKRSRAL